MENNKKGFVLSSKKLLLLYGLSFLFVLAGIISGNLYIGIFSFIIFFFLPGIITLSAVGIIELTGPVLLFSVGLSLAELIAIGLLTNLFFFQTSLPLYPYHIFSVALLFGFIKSIFLFKQNRSLLINPPQFSKFDFLLLPFPIFSLLLAIGGAIRLNNAYSNELSLIALGIISVCVLLIILINKKFSETAILISIFLISLSVLFMVSLRSLGISGHDIRSEYNVYLKTMDGLRWSMAKLYDAYNACMSITILPTISTEMFNITGFIFFKIIAQIIFSLVPLIIYYFAKSHLDKKLATISSLLFITFPTFLIDSPMIVRQEIGFLFFSLLIFLLYGEIKIIGLKTKNLLFLLFSFSLILSHYSSAYIYIGLLTFITIIKVLLSIFKKNISGSEQMITPVSYFIVLFFAILWYAQITAVSTGFTGTLINSIKDIPNIYSQDNRDGSVNYLFLKPAVDQGKQVIDYEQTTAKNPTISPNLQFIPQTDDTKWANLFNTVYYSIGPKVYELLVGLGLFAIFFFKRLRAKHLISGEFVFFTFIGVFLIFLQVVLPNLTLSYGLMRAFQQMLIFLVLPIAIILFASLRRFTQLFSFLLVIGLLLVYSGFINQFVRGVPAEFSLHNYGPYYSAYYYHPEDVASLSLILNSEKNYESVHSNIAGTLLTVYPYRYDFSSNILPFQVSNTDQIIVGEDAIKEGLVYVAVSGKLLPVKLSLSEYGNRNIVYSNGAGVILDRNNLVQ